MEDEILIQQVDQKQETYLIGIFDGHGGKEVSEFLATNASKYFLLSPLDKEQIRQSFLKLDQDISRYCSNKHGSTAAIALFQRENKGWHIYIAHVGDSRIVLLNSNFQIVHVTEDHNANSEAETKRVVAAGGVIINKRLNGTLAITRALGDFYIKEKHKALIAEPEVVEFRITTPHTILLFSDGLFEDTVKSIDRINETKNLMNFCKPHLENSQDLAYQCASILINLLEKNDPLPIFDNLSLVTARICFPQIPNQQYQQEIHQKNNFLEVVPFLSHEIGENIQEDLVFWCNLLEYVRGYNGPNLQINYIKQWSEIKTHYSKTFWTPFPLLSNPSLQLESKPLSHPSKILWVKQFLVTQYKNGDSIYMISDKTRLDGPPLLIVSNNLLSINQEGECSKIIFCPIPLSFNQSISTELPKDTREQTFYLPQEVDVTPSVLVPPYSFLCLSKNHVNQFEWNQTRVVWIKKLDSIPKHLFHVSQLDYTEKDGSKTVIYKDKSIIYRTLDNMTLPLVFPVSNLMNQTSPTLVLTSSSGDFCYAFQLCGWTNPGLNYIVQEIPLTDLPHFPLISREYKITFNEPVTIECLNSNVDGSTLWVVASQPFKCTIYKFNLLR